MYDGISWYGDEIVCNLFRPSVMIGSAQSDTAYQMFALFNADAQVSRTRGTLSTGSLV